MDKSDTAPVIDVETIRIPGGSGNIIVADRYGPETGEPILLQHAGGQSRHNCRLHCLELSTPLQEYQHVSCF